MAGKKASEAQPLSDETKVLVSGPNFAHLATLMPDGSPQADPVWVHLEGENIVIGSSAGTPQRATRPPHRVVDRGDGQSLPGSAVSRPGRRAAPRSGLRHDGSHLAEVHRPGVSVPTSARATGRHGDRGGMVAHGQIATNARAGERLISLSATGVE